VGEGGTFFPGFLECSCRQRALAWELRAAINLAELLSGQKRNEDAKALLRPIFEQFERNPDTADLKIAGKLLAII
jgi:predicted ATPase